MLPDAEAIAALEAAGGGLTSPELAALLAHSKLDLTARVLATDLPDAPAFAPRVAEYFPTAAAASGSPTRSARTHCAGRSSPRSWSTRWSTAPA